MVTANKKKPVKGGDKSKAAEKAEKARIKAEKAAKVARDGSLVPKKGESKTEAQLREEKLLHVAQSLARGKGVEAEIKVRKAELVAEAMEPDAAAIKARAEAVERMKPQAAEMIAQSQKTQGRKGLGKFEKQPIKAEADKVAAPAETVGPHFVQNKNGSNDAAESGEEQVIMKNDEKNDEKNIVAGTEHHEDASEQVEKRLSVSNVKDLFQHVDFNQGIEIPGYIDLVSEMDGSALTLETAVVVPVLGRNRGELYVAERAFYTEEQAKICVQTMNDHYALKKDDVVRFKMLVAVLKAEKQSFGNWMLIKGIAWREKETWRGRTEMLGHSSDPFSLPLVAGTLPVIEDKTKAGVLNTWDEYREDLAHFILECGSRIPEEPEQWTEFLRNFDDDRRRRNRRNPRFPIAVISTGLFKTDMPDGAVIAVPEDMLGMVLDVLADADVKVYYAWAYRWLTQTKEMLPWFAARAEELAEELAEQKRQEEQRKLEAENLAKKKAAQDALRFKFQEKLLQLGGRGVPNTSRDRDDDGDDRSSRGGGNSRRWDTGRTSDARR